MVRIKSLLLGLVAVMLFAVIPLAAAQDSQVGNGMQISPTRTEMSLQPGEQKDFTITVKNVADGPLTMRSSINDFESDGVSGSPQIIVDENRQVPTSLRNYVKGLGEFELQPGESKEVNLTVDVPVDVAPGAYFGAVRFTIVPSDGANSSSEGTQVSLNASVASLLFLEVSGDITQQIQIENMKVCSIEVKETQKSEETAGQGSGIAQNCDKNNSLFFTPPTVASIKIANKGNGFSRPFGRVSLSRGNTEVYAYELNNSDPRGTILPNSTRVFSNKIEGANKFGRYTLTASLSHGDGGEVIVQKSSFWYIPTWILIIAGIALVGLLVVAFVTYKKLGKKRK